MTIREGIGGWVSLRTYGDGVEFEKELEKGVEMAVEKVVDKRLDAIKDIVCNSRRSTHTGCDEEELVSRSI